MYITATKTKLTKSFIHVASLKSAFTSESLMSCIFFSSPVLYLLTEGNEGEAGRVESRRKNFQQMLQSCGSSWPTGARCGSLRQQHCGGGRGVWLRVWWANLLGPMLLPSLCHLVRQAGRPQEDFMYQARTDKVRIWMQSLIIQLPCHPLGSLF